MNLNYGILLQNMFNLQNRSPEDGTRSCISGSPKGGIGVIFSLQNVGKERVFICDNIPSCVDKQAFINELHISNAETTFIFRFADIIPRAKSNRVSGIFSLNTCPPKVPDDGVNFVDESFGEKHSRHVVNRNRRQDRIDVLESTRMVELVGF
jgi:hypothetical protein